jgi:hypothetical protein
MTAPGLPIIVASNGRGLPVTLSSYGVPIKTSTNGFGCPIVVKASGGLPVKYVDAAPPNLLAGLPWIAGAFTVLSLQGIYERGTQSGGTNPRLFKHPTGLTIGHTYKLRGLARPETDGSTFLRASTTSGLLADGPVNFNFSGPLLLDVNFVAARTDYFIGVVIISDANDTYVEIEDAFSLTDIT